MFLKFSNAKGFPVQAAECFLSKSKNVRKLVYKTIVSKNEMQFKYTITEKLFPHNNNYFKYCNTPTTRRVNSRVPTDAARGLPKRVRLSTKGSIEGGEVSLSEFYGTLLEPGCTESVSYLFEGEPKCQRPRCHADPDWEEPLIESKRTFVVHGFH